MKPLPSWRHVCPHVINQSSASFLIFRDVTAENASFLLSQQVKDVEMWLLYFCILDGIFTPMRLYLRKAATGY